MINEDAIQIIDDALQDIAEGLKIQGCASLTVSDAIVPVIKESFSHCEIREQPMLFNSTLLTIINNRPSGHKTQIMKWIKIDKAKPVFNQQYLVKIPELIPTLGTLHSVTAIGPLFAVTGLEEPTAVTHIAIVTDPGNE